MPRLGDRVILLLALINSLIYLAFSPWRPRIYRALEYTKLNQPTPTPTEQLPRQPIPAREKHAVSITITIVQNPSSALPIAVTPAVSRFKSACFLYPPCLKIKSVPVVEFLGHR
jgi:hypothetical protein